MIYGYPHAASVAPGDDLVLHVSTDAPAFCADFYRCGSDMVHRGRSEWFEGALLPHHLPHQDWGQENVDLRGEVLGGWPAYHVAVPEDWESGVYVAVLVEGDGSTEGRRRDVR